MVAAFGLLVLMAPKIGFAVIVRVAVCAILAGLFLVFGKWEEQPVACVVPRNAPGVVVEPINAFFFTPALSNGFSISSLFSTHPSLEKRLEQLAKISVELGQPR